MNERLRNGLLNLGLVVASVVVFLVVLEGYFAVFNPQITEVKYPDTFVADETLGWIHKPNTEGIFASSEFTTHIKINSKGLRDREYNYNKPDGIKRIIVLGDSQTEGWGVEDGERFTEVLEDSLLKDVQVINMGVWSYGNDQELLTLKNEGVKYNPDLVIVAFSCNDIVDNMNSDNNMFVLNADNELILTNISVSRKSDASDNQNNLFVTFQRFFQKYSHTYHFAFNRLLTNPIGKNLLVTLIAKLGLTEIYTQWYNLFSNTYTPEVQYGCNLTKAILKEIDVVAKENNAKTLIVLTTRQFQVYYDTWREAAGKVGITTQFCNISKPNDLIVEFGKKNDILVLDLLPEFREHAENGEQLHFYKDGHWNANGHKLAAELIYDKLIEEQLIPLGGEH